MIYALFGKIVRLQPQYLVLNVRDVSYQIFIANPNDFTLNDTIEIFTYQVIREDDAYLIGFPSLLEKEVFQQLLSVKGIGPKTALGALSGTNPTQLIAAINNGHIAFLKSLPGIGPKAASQIVLDLKGKLVDQDQGSSKLSSQFSEAKDALKSLGFKNQEIDQVLKFIDPTLTHSETIIKLALKGLKK